MTKIKAFTLIEILIALAVFAILATLSASAIYYAFDTRQRVSAKAEQLLDLQLALGLFEQDTAQTIARTVRSKNMQIIPAFIGKNNYLEVTRTGYINPDAQQKRSTLQRIAWICKDSSLLRRSWPQLDIVERSNYQEKTILKNLKHCSFAYLDDNLQTLTTWRESTPTTGAANQLPKAVKITIDIKNWGEGNFLMMIPGAAYARVD